MLVPAEDGHWISEEHDRINQLLQEYDPHLSLAWIPPENRDPKEEFPFAVMHAPPTRKEPYVLFRVRESEMDHRLLARVYLGDLTKHDVLDQLEAEERAKRKLRNAELADAAAFRRDLVKSIVANNKSTFKHNGKVYPT